METERIKFPTAYGVYTHTAQEHRKIEISFQERNFLVNKIVLSFLHFQSGIDVKRSILLARNFFIFPVIKVGKLLKHVLDKV